VAAFQDSGFAFQGTGEFAFQTASGQPARSLHHFRLRESLMNFLRQATAVDIGLGPFVDSTDGVTPETALSITQAETRLKKNAGAWAQASDVTTATHEEEGWYEKELDATDTDTVGSLIVAVYVAGALPVWRNFQVVEETIYDNIYAASAAGYSTQASVDSLNYGIIIGNAVTGTLTTTQATSSLTGYDDNQLIGRAITWITGACEGEARRITDYASASGLLTFQALTIAPSNGDFFKIT
jgi:hypothetical protein